MFKIFWFIFIANKTQKFDKGQKGVNRGCGLKGGCKLIKGLGDFWMKNQGLEDSGFDVTCEECADDLCNSAKRKEIFPLVATLLVVLSFCIL